MINPKWVQVGVLIGHWDTWVTYRDEIDVEEGLSGRTYRSPGQVHLDRLARAANNPENNYRISLDFSGFGPQIIIHRGQNENL